MAELRDSFNSKKAQWENEKNALGKVQHLREEIDAAKIELEKARRDNDWGKAAELANGKLPELTRQLEAEEKASEAQERIQSAS